VKNRMLFGIGIAGTTALVCLTIHDTYRERAKFAAIQPWADKGQKICEMVKFSLDVAVQRLKNGVLSDQKLSAATVFGDRAQDGAMLVDMCGAAHIDTERFDHCKLENDYACMASVIESVKGSMP
jgi:hypothetical protein